MTNYESIKNMSIEDMAKMNVKTFMYMNGYRANVEYHTTNQSIFDTREEAEEYELKWLQSNEDRETLDTITLKTEWNDDLLGLESEVNFMDYKLLAQKYIKYGIEWLESEFDTYKGMTTIMETEENLNGEQLRMLCDEIKKDTRVKIAMIESDHEYTITIMFNR